MKTNEEKEVQELPVAKKCTNRCSDFDDECKDVKNHLGCWLGNSVIGCADGLCPFVHTTN